ncbi:MAG: hypothetical protein IIT71_04825, partial [Acetobacter sp.]|nr:hypothetical protein [Acetobacter sp.]
KEHLLTDGALPSAPPPPPPAPPPINWAQYKITFSSIFVGAIERVLDPSLIKTSIRKLEQQLQEVHQQLQNIHQQLQNIHQAFSGSHPHTMLVESKATMDSPSADLKFWESLPYHGTAGSLGIINWQKALIAAQHGNWIPTIAIYSQTQPQTWRNYFVNYYKWCQKTNQKVKIDNNDISP